MPHNKCVTTTCIPETKAPTKLNDGIFDRDTINAHANGSDEDDLRSVDLESGGAERQEEESDIPAHPEQQEQNRKAKWKAIFFRNKFSLLNLGESFDSMVFATRMVW
mmetsp:Transcript_3885/g.7726  ORF Transcript_3885/g.7726 Transcript_3885/m.7726 type:complete len:107 (+) Transcript_3885:3-323(+)